MSLTSLHRNCMHSILRAIEFELPLPQGFARKFCLQQQLQCSTAG